MLKSLNLLININIYQNEHKIINKKVIANWIFLLHDLLAFTTTELVTNSILFISFSY